LDFKVIEWNPAAEIVFGYSKEEATGKHATELILPEEIKEVINGIFRDLISEKGGTRSTNENITKDGRQIICDWYNTTLKDADGKVVGVASLVHDITERKRAEEALRDSQEKYRTMLENIEDGYYEADLQGNFTFFNESMCRILGYTAEEMMGMNNRKYLDKKNAKKALKIYKNVFRTEKAHKSFDWEIVRKDGSKGSVEVSITLIRDSNGQPVGFRGVARDVTDKKHLELQLQHAQKMEAIGTFAGGIAHDFNNILASIILNSELALDDIPESNDAIYSLEQVLNNSLRAKDLVKHILTFGRLEEVERMPLKVSIIVQESLKMLRAMLPTTIAIRQNILSDVGTILADPTQIQQLITNLCSNSLHAMKENGGTLDVELKNVKIDKRSSYTNLKTGSYVKLTIKDSGYGIEPENKARIFDPFFTTKQPGEGTGLGLSVVHGIVISNDGTIKVDSKKNKGTTFHIFFPIINDAIIPFYENDRSLPIGNERILFVDDEEALVDSCRRTLERIGYTVVALNSGAQALELFQSNHDNFDLVITDTTMPNITGVQLSEKLLKICPDIPIIICTGHSDLITQEKLDTIGIRECVMKPFKMQEIAETIRKVLDNKSVERRRYERFKVKDGAIAIPTSDFSKQGKIIDICKK
jgi:PAS domain S-box-containing protein